MRARMRVRRRPGLARMRVRRLVRPPPRSRWVAMARKQQQACWRPAPPEPLRPALVLRQAAMAVQPVPRDTLSQAARGDRQAGASCWRQERRRQKQQAQGQRQGWRAALASARGRCVQRERRQRERRLTEQRRRGAAMARSCGRQGGYRARSACCPMLRARHSLPERRSRWAAVWRRRPAHSPDPAGIAPDAPPPPVAPD